MSQQYLITECPRDAMQGWTNIIQTETKIRYINQLLKVGFDVLDFGSFVSPKAIPQMADTEKVLESLELSETKTRLLSIVANAKGAAQAVVWDEISILGYPLSVSETFQKRNSNKTIAESLIELENISEMCVDNNKTLLVYLSMGFGNPYGDPYEPEILAEFIQKCIPMGISHFALSDTIGNATPALLESIFSTLIPEFQDQHLSAHLHARMEESSLKINAAWKGGCRSFDTSIKGFGGCPMANDHLVGNIATEIFLATLTENQIPHHLDLNAFSKSVEEAGKVFL